MKNLWPIYGIFTTCIDPPYMLLNLGSGYGNGSESKFNLTTPVTLKPGRNDLALLSMTVGLQVSDFPELHLNWCVSIEALGTMRSISFKIKKRKRKRKEVTSLQIKLPQS